MFIFETAEAISGFKHKKSIWHAWTKFPLSRLWNSRDIGQNLSGVFLSDTRGGRAWSLWKKCLVTITAFKQGHPTTVFRKISVQRSKYWLKLSITRGRLKTSRWPFHSFTVFEAYLINSLLFFEGYFSHYTFHWIKGNLSLMQKCDGERNQEGGKR